MPHEMIPVPLVVTSSSTRRRRGSSRAPQDSPSLSQANRAPSGLYCAQSSPPPRAVGIDEHEAAMAARDRLDVKFRTSGLINHRLSSTTPSPNNTLVASSNARVHPSSSLRQKVFPPSAGATTLTSRDRKLRMKAPTVCETSSHIRNARSSTSHVHISNKEGERTIRSPSLTSTLDNDIRSDSIDGVESSTSSNHGNLVFDVDLGDCSICLESFSEDKAFICLPCNHRFHTTCLGAWLKKHSQCPNCRTNVPKVGNLVQCCIISNETIDRNKQEL